MGLVPYKKRPEIASFLSVKSAAGKGLSSEPDHVGTLT